MKRAWIVALAVAAVAGTAGGGVAQAQDVLELHTVKGDQGRLLVAVANNGVTFINPKENKVFRGFKTTRRAMKGTSPDWFVMRDVDNNGTVDIVANGAPAFIISGDGAPIYSLAKGCDQFDLGDYGADRSQDILCRKGNSITVTTYDGQKLWEYDIRGLRLGVCRFGDLNGDLKVDVECDRSRGGVIRLNGPDGADLGERDSGQLGEPEDDNPGYASEMANYLKGEQTFDLNGDGTAEEMLTLDGTGLVVRSKSSPKALARHEVGKAFSVLVDDLDGDGDQEIAVGGQGKVFIIDHEGKLVATIATNPARLKRSTDVQLTRVSANSLADASEEGNKAVIDKGLDALGRCYAGNVRRDPFTRVGRTVHALSINSSGSVTKVERLHSSLGDKKLNSCVEGALKKLKFSKGTGPDATVTLNLNFGFVDQ